MPSVDEFPQHEDLADMLRKLAVDAGASIHLDAEVKTVRPGSGDDPRPSVVLSTGNVLAADLLIGADGSSSIVRDAVVEEKSLLKSAGLTVYTGTLEAADMLNDPELSTLYHADDVSTIFFRYIGLGLDLTVFSGRSGWANTGV